MTVRVVVADDHPIFRDGLVSILRDEGGIEIVAEASNGREAIDAVAAHEPDVVLMDIRMPEMTGIEATQRLSKQYPNVAVLSLTMNEDEESIFSSLKAGAHGYLLKESTKDDIVRAVQALARGEAVFGSGITAKVLSFFSSSANKATPASPFPQLSDRETEVLKLMAQGHDNSTIARKLYVSDKTVRNNVSMIFTKLQVPGRPEAIAAAQAAGISN